MSAAAPMSPSSTSSEPLARLRDRVLAAASDGTPLVIRGGGTKAFYGNPTQGDPLDAAEHRGIVSYEPTELVITARCGTPLAELQDALAAQRQFLPFEPPAFGEGATVGGMVACGLSGPRRAAAGALRDYVLGAALLDGRGRLLYFGGQVMKNVAGYDVSRALAGSLGMLGVITEVSIKVLPLPPAEASLAIEADEATALRMMNTWAGQPLPVSATAWREGTLTVRLSGARAAVDSARERFAQAHAARELDAEQAHAFWQDLREQRDAFFAGDAPLWRLSVPSTVPRLGLPGAQLIEWGGALRWWRSDADASAIRGAAQAAGGSATLFRGGARGANVFDALPPAIADIHRRLKDEFDPRRIFNRGRLVPGL